MEETKVLVDSPRMRGVNVGEKPLGVVGVGDIVENPRLPEGGDDPLPRRGTLVRVEDGGEIVREDFPTLRPDRLGLLLLVRDGLVESVEADDVAGLIPREAFQPAKNTQVERLGEVRGVRHQKGDGDVFGDEQLPERLDLVGLAPVDDEDILLVKGPKLLSEGGTAFVDGGDKHLGEP